MHDERGARSGDGDDGDDLAERIAAGMDGPVTALGAVFALLVLAEITIEPTGSVATAFSVASWALWAVFVAEFLLRLAVAPSKPTFLRRNWWQLVFLAVPFLRFLRALRAIRAARAARVGRVLSSAVRTTRSAGRRLSNRLAWLGVSTVIVVLAGSEILYTLDTHDRYGDALYAAALATLAGEPIHAHGWARGVELLLVLWSVVVFAAVAGSVGAYLLERSRVGPDRDGATAPPATGG